jgi:hypothetical protein
MKHIFAKFYSNPQQHSGCDHLHNISLKHVGSVIILSFRSVTFEQLYLCRNATLVRSYMFILRHTSLSGCLYFRSV